MLVLFVGRLTKVSSCLIKKFLNFSSKIPSIQEPLFVEKNHHFAMSNGQIIPSKSFLIVRTPTRNVRHDHKLAIRLLISNKPTKHFVFNPIP
jgi:hypothetical protein